MLPEWKRLESYLYSDLKSFCSKYKAYLTLSWGKQSICIAHAVWKTQVGIPCVFFSSPYARTLHNYDEVKNNFLSRFPINYEDEWHEVHLKPEIQRWKEGKGFTGCIMGLCGIESKARKQTCMKAKHSVFEYKDGTARLTPLGRWTDDDVCAYIAKYDLPLLDTYIKYGIHERTSSGLAPNHPTALVMDKLSSTQQEEVRRLWKERGLL